MNNVLALQMLEPEASLADAYGSWSTLSVQCCTRTDATAITVTIG